MGACVEYACNKDIRKLTKVWQIEYISYTTDHIQIITINASHINKGDI